jgi:DNA-directed RNA polymerase subunit RPC12/RpoP
MALIKCPECGREISDKAAACPECAYPIKALTIEATAKRWKALELFGALAVVIGVVWIIAGSLAQTEEYVFSALVLTSLGLLLYFVARFMAWWHHG